MNLTPYIGIPFKSHGRTVEGCDCWGLIRLFYNRELNIKLPSHDNLYDSALDYEAIQNAISNNKQDWNQVTQPSIGDVILLRIRGLADHVAVALDNSRMLHTTEGVDSCIERYNTPIYLPRIVGFFRYAGNNNKT